MISRKFFRRSPRRPRFQPAVLGSYTTPGFWQRHRIKLLLLVSLYSWFVGMFFAITTTYFLVPLLIPLALLATLVIWLLPDLGKAPTRLMAHGVFAFVIVLLCWPNYIGIDLPGLPWITLLRLVSLPLGLVLLVSLSVSREFRRELVDTLSVMPAVSWLLGVFAVIAFLSIFWSTGLAYSANKFSVAIFSWFAPFFAAVYVFRTPGRLRQLAITIWGITIFASLIGLVEAHEQHVLWAGHLPKLLSIQDETVMHILAGATRGSTGKYRIVSVFPTPLNFAEYLGLAMPFIMHFGLTARRLFVRVAAFVTIPAIFWILTHTDSRMGMINFFLAVLFYLFFWSLLYRRKRPDSPIGTMVLGGYPALFVASIASAIFVGRIRHLVWGDGSQESSNDMRKAQIEIGIPKILDRPWGWGMGRAPETLGLPSIDNFYLTVGLEYGLIGFVVFFGMFAIAIWNGLRRAIIFPDGELGLIVPLCISLINFVIVKLTLSQQDAHGFVFVMLGALVACCWRIDREVAPTGAVRQKSAPRPLAIS